MERTSCFYLLGASSDQFLYFFRTNLIPKPGIGPLWFFRFGGSHSITLGIFFGAAISAAKHPRKERHGERRRRRRETALSKVTKERPGACHSFSKEVELYRAPSQPTRFLRQHGKDVCFLESDSRSVTRVYLSKTADAQNASSTRVQFRGSRAMGGNGCI